MSLLRHQIEPESHIFQLFETMVRAAEVATENDRSIGEFIEEWERMRAAGRPQPAAPLKS